MSRKNYLITGGAGFIGSHSCEQLVKDGQRVRVLDNLSTGKQENLIGILGDVELLKGDIRDPRIVTEAMKEIDIVFHEAALGSVPRSVADPIGTHETNINGTLNILLAARDSGVKRVVYASSSSVYGESLDLPKHEKMMPAPLSPYALSKLTGEHYCTLFNKAYGLDTVSLRYFNIFGPKQDPDSEYAAVIPRFLTSLIRDERPLIYGDGLQTRDFTFIENTVEANLLASEAEDVQGKVFNIACGQRYTILDLLNNLKELLGSKVEAIFKPPREGDVRDSLASIEAARNAFGYRVVVGFEEGLRRTVRWFTRHLDPKTGAES